MSCTSSGTLQVTIGGAAFDCPSGTHVGLAGKGNYNRGAVVCPDNSAACAGLTELACRPSGNCNGHGTCVSGRCHCDFGYAGEDCGSRTCTSSAHQCASPLVCDPSAGVCRLPPPPPPPIESPPPPNPAPPSPPPPAPCGAAVPGDADALLRFKSGRSYSSKLGSWTECPTMAHVCSSYQGVTCNPAGTRVTEL